MIIRSGKVKDILHGPEEGTILLRFRDRVTAGNGEREANFPGKGRLCAAISARLFEILEEGGVKTHFLGFFSPDTLLVRELEMFPLEVIIRNIAAGSLVRRLGYRLGASLEPPVVEFYLKSDELHDPLLCREHIELLELASLKELERMRKITEEVNTILFRVFEERGLRMADLKLEFGRVGRRILLGDELSPEVMRLWDLESSRSYDKDVFRKGTGDLMEAYREVARRLDLEL